MFTSISATPFSSSFSSGSFSASSSTISSATPSCPASAAPWCPPSSSSAAGSATSSARRRQEMDSKWSAPLPASAPSPASDRTRTRRVGQKCIADRPDGADSGSESSKTSPPTRRINRVSYRTNCSTGSARYSGSNEAFTSRTCVPWQRKVNWRSFTEPGSPLLDLPKASAVSRPSSEAAAVTLLGPTPPGPRPRWSPRPRPALVPPLRA
mmetsp:Transcript_19818/g.64396  ORF Transcript_19818/g.64396 Transcript_19818/m.64396 type:complete len:210 (-) Transcript_19818:204-833(-)